MLSADNHGCWEVDCNPRGHDRCWSCPANFSPAMIELLFKYHHFSQLPASKNFRDNFLFFQQEFNTRDQMLKEAEKAELNCSPYYVTGLWLFCKQLGKEEILPHLVVGMDNLHNIRGWFCRLAFRLLETGWMDSVEFQLAGKAPQRHHGVVLWC